MVVLVVTTHPNMWFWKYWDCIPGTIPSLGGQVVCFLGGQNWAPGQILCRRASNFHLPIPYLPAQKIYSCLWRSSISLLAIVPRSLTLRSPPKSHVIHVLPCPRHRVNHHESRCTSPPVPPRSVPSACNKVFRKAKRVTSWGSFTRLALGIDISPKMLPKDGY